MYKLGRVYTKGENDERRNERERPLQTNKRAFRPVPVPQMLHARLIVNVIRNRLTLTVSLTALLQIQLLAEKVTCDEKTLRLLDRYKLVNTKVTLPRLHL